MPLEGLAKVENLIASRISAIDLGILLTTTWEIN
jgi:hypothetical protein